MCLYVYIYIYTYIYIYIYIYEREREGQGVKVKSAAAGGAKKSSCRSFLCHPRGHAQSNDSTKDIHGRPGSESMKYHEMDGQLRIVLMVEDVEGWERKTFCRYSLPHFDRSP